MQQGFDPPWGYKYMTFQQAKMIWAVILIIAITALYFFLFYFEYMNYAYIKIEYMKQDYSNYCYFNCVKQGFWQYGSCVKENQCQKAQRELMDAKNTN